MASFKVCSQDKTEYILSVNPVGMQIGQSHIDEFGEGIFELKKVNKNNFDIGFIISKSIHKKFDLLFGFSFRKLKYAFEFNLFDPFNPNNVIINQNRYNDRLVFAPLIGIRHSWSKFSISTSIEPALEINIQTNLEYYNSPLYVFIDAAGQKSAYFSYIERDNYRNKLTLFMAPKLSFDYKITDRTSIGLRFLIKPYGNNNLYFLRVDGNIGELPDGNHILNDTRINSKMFYGFLGFNASLF